MRTIRITPEERLAQIAARIAEGARLPPPEALRNSGARRTPSKRALLERIEGVRAAAAAKARGAE